jgi:PAS domain S-box-containing protein
VQSGGQPEKQRWFLLTLALSCATILALIFSVWELVEHRFFQDIDYQTLHFLYITRGITTSLLVGLWAAWFVMRERRQHEQELERSREHYRSILRSTPEAVVLFDQTFHVKEWNEAAEQLYGLSRERVVGGLLPVVPPDRLPELRELLAQLEEKRMVLDFETERCHAGGERISVAASFSLVSQGNDRPPLYLEVAQDIRPRLQMRDKLMEMEKLSLMGQMAAGTAHHLNTPLTAMLLQVEMLRQRPRNSEEDKDLATVESRIRFCQVFVQNVLRFAHRSHQEQKPVPLADVVEGAGALFRPQLQLKQVQLQIDLSGLAQGVVLGDPTHLSAMFSALVSNAVDAAPAHSGISIYGSVENDDTAKVVIEDSGPGIPESLWARLFEPFYTTKPAGRGTGLGLPIARNIIESHGGVLEISNRKEDGASVVVRLPLFTDQAVKTGMAARREVA